MSDQLSFGDDPEEPRAHARNTDPQTSHDAAASLAPAQLRATQLAVLTLFELYGAMTDEKVAELYPRHIITPRQSPSGLRTRRAELVELGKLKDTGRRGTTLAGRKTIIWAEAI